MDQFTPPNLCPLCHSDNRCGALLGTRCWCMDMNIPQTLLDEVPEKDKRRTCICRECVERSNVSFQLARESGGPSRPEPETP